jgi:diguanylate cyclase (GGDEF)-like protein
MTATLLAAVPGVEVVGVVTLPTAPSDIDVEPSLTSASARSCYAEIAACALAHLDTEGETPFALAAGGVIWHGLLRPVKIDGGATVAGVIFARQEETWNEHEHEVLAALTTMTSAAATSANRDKILVRQSHLDELVTTVAEHLMLANSENQQENLDWVAQTLAEFFGSDVSFIRRNDYERESSVLVAEFPLWDESAGVHPFGEIRFDSDPVFERSRDLRQPWFGSEDDSDTYVDLLEQIVDTSLVAGIMVPLLVNDQTWGILGFIHFGLYAWTRADVNALTSVASLVSQLHARFDAEHDATHDELTGLHNRRALLIELDTRLARGEEPSVMMLDLDRFKVMNDYLGHAHGNALLVAVADRIRFSTRPGDFTARLHGDEFIFVMGGPAGVLEASALAHRMLALISAPVDVDGQSVSHTASIGVAFSDPDSTSVSLLAAADLAMYCAKEKGRNQVVLYDEDLAEIVRDRSRTEILLADSVRLGQLRLHYQPEIDLKNGRLLALEALVRWEHPTRGLLNASEFIPLAEESGMVCEIGRWVLHEACTQMAQWLSRYPDLDVVVRVNISPADLKIGDFVTYIRKCLLKSKLPPSRLCIEITEHVMVQEYAYSARILNKLRALGITVAIDDFGTGFASMTELKHLPADFLKLDMSFVRGIATDRYDRAIIESIIRLADALDLGIIAEGVEEESVARELVAMGCSRAQGYLFARPAPAADFESMLSSGFVMRCSDDRTVGHEALAAAS